MNNQGPVALVTGGARRVGASIAEHLYAAGYRVLIHYRHSNEEADALVARLNRKRHDSAHALRADLLDVSECEALAERAIAHWQRLDLLVNNASTFYPTTVGETTEEQWRDLSGSNLQAPYFLIQACLPTLRECNGNVVNIIDIHAQRPLEKHAVYSTAKAGLHAMTRALARELGPAVRVNGVAPGAILWPESGSSEAQRAAIVAATPLARTGTPEDIARTVLFLAQSPFITGQIIAVDGGRSL